MPFAPLGKYTITFTLAGFKTRIHQEVDVRLNITTTVDARLEVAEQAESVTVTAAVPQIDTTSGEVKTSFDSQFIEDKPIFNRNMLALVNDVPGFQTNAVSGQNNPTASSGSSVQINGTGTRSATFSTDGVNNDDSSENQHRQTVNISAIKEFQVLRNNFSAEFGRGAGAVVLVQTKSGTNAFHGDAYWYTQNNIFNAQSYFGNLAGARKSATHRHLFGGTVGGPILRDKLFVFQSFERISDRGAGLQSRDILLADERSVDPTAPNLTAADRAWIDGIINRFPNVAPNSPNLGPRVYSAQVGFNRPASDYGTRADYTLDENNSFMFRYQYSTQVFDNDDTLVRGEATKQNNRQQNFGLTHTHIFSPRTVGEFRFAVGRRRTTVNIKDGNETPIVRFTGLARGTSLGSSGVFPILRFQTDYQYVYNLSTLLGSRNAIKFGTDIRRQQLNDRADQFSRGFWTFNISGGRTAIENFRRNFVSSFQRSWGPNFLGNRTGEFNFYIQDDWKPTRSLTLNFGARIEYVLKLSEVNKLLDYGFDNDRYIDPRFGFAWSPAAKSGLVRGITGGPGRSVIRGGFGLFHGRLYQSVFSQNGASIRFNPPNALTQTYSNVTGLADPSGGFVFVPGTIPTTRYTPTFVDSGLRMPYTEQWNLTLERQLPKLFALSVSYTGNRGIGLLLYDTSNRAEFPIRAPDHANVTAANRGQLMNCIDPNLNNTNPAPGCISLAQPRYNDRRPDPRYTGILRVFNGSWSYYNGLQVSVTKRYSSGFSLNTNYTFSKAIDTGSEATFTGLDLGSSTNGKNSAAAFRGLSLFHQAHRAVFNYSYRTPFLANWHPALRQVLGGWQVAGTTTFSSGNPFTISSGYDVNSDGSSSDRPFLRNPAILGTSIDNARLDPATGRQISQGRIKVTDLFPNSSATDRVFLPGGGNQGDLGRNTFFAHGGNNTDIQFSKGFRVREGHQLIFRMEFYNLLNRIQWGYPANRSALNSNASFMQITGQRNGPRTGQFVMRYTF
ncbi:MAG: TonB-dependent receptor [Acidobacteriota bacterium]